MLNHAMWQFVRSHLLRLEDLGNETEMRFSESGRAWISLQGIVCVCLTLQPDDNFKIGFSLDCPGATAATFLHDFQRYSPHWEPEQDPFMITEEGHPVWGVAAYTYKVLKDRERKSGEYDS